MPFKTIWECPHCQCQVRVASSVASLIVCPTCKTKIRANPDGSEEFESIPVALNHWLEDVLTARDEALAATSSQESELIGPIRGAPKPVMAGATPAKSRVKRPAPFTRSRGMIAKSLIFFGVMGLVFFMIWYSRTVGSLMGRVEDVSQERSRKVKAATDTRRAFPKVVTPGPTTGPVRMIAPATRQIGDLVVGVSDAKLGDLPLRNGRSSLNCLALTLRITNLGLKPMQYHSWNYAGRRVTLSDRSRNYYNRLALSPGDPPPQFTQGANIQPGVTVTDLLAFEPIPGSTVDLELDLTTADGKDVFRFTIPAGMVRQPVAALPANPLTAMNQQPTPPPPLPPREDPTVRQNIVSEYRSATKSIDAKAKLMRFDDGRKFRRLSRAALAEKLAKKYSLSQDEVETILPQ